MFICDQCKTLTSPKEKETKVVVKTRPKTYKHKKIKGRKEVIITTHGFEIVKEIRICPRCASSIDE